jgi:hypothetical protein
MPAEEPAGRDSLMKGASGEFSGKTGIQLTGCADGTNRMNAATLSMNSPCRVIAIGDRASACVPGGVSRVEMT